MSIKEAPKKIFIQDLKDWTKAAALIREKSFSPRSQTYRLTTTDAAEKAVPKEHKEVARLIGLALDGWWNDTLAWAEH